jgi:hypothetical protein
MVVSFFHWTSSFISNRREGMAQGGCDWRQTGSPVAVSKVLL